MAAVAEPAELFLNELFGLLNHCRQRIEQEGSFEVTDYEVSRRRLEHHISVLEFMDSELNPLPDGADGTGVQTINAPALHGLLIETRPWLTWLNSQPVSTEMKIGKRCWTHI